MIADLDMLASCSMNAARHLQKIISIENRDRYMLEILNAGGTK